MNVQFEDEALSKIHFTGSVGRYENVNILLNAIEKIKGWGHASHERD